MKTKSTKTQNNNFFQKYKYFFTGEKLINSYDNTSAFPGEHHFVSLCLLPILVKKFKLQQIKYVNPDGMKSFQDSILISDLTVVVKRKIMGIEVKYSRTKSISFTLIQLKKIISFENDRHRKFLGIVALLDVDKEDSSIVHIKFDKNFKKAILLKLKNKNINLEDINTGDRRKLSIQCTTSRNVLCEDEPCLNCTKINEEKFINIFN